MINQIEVAEDLMDIWEASIPGAELPPRTKFVQWAGMAEPEVLAHAIRRTSRRNYNSKQKGISLTSDQLQAYVTGVIGNELREKKEAVNG